MLALLHNIATLDYKEELLEEVIVVNNASTADYTEVEEYIKKNPTLPVQYIFSNENLGVAKGRNYAVNHAKADLLVMLDDDAELENKNALKAIHNTFSKNNTIAIASFKVKYDLSYKLISKGYKIVYTDEIIMLHKESPQGRSPHKEKMKMLWLNKSKVAWRYLPTIYFITTSIMWSMEYLMKSKFDLLGFFKGWNNIITAIPHEKRQTLDSTTIDYLKQMDARLWY